MVRSAIQQFSSRFKSARRRSRSQRTHVQNVCDTLEVRRLLSGSNTAPVIDASVDANLVLQVSVTDDTEQGMLELEIDVNMDGSIEHWRWMDAGSQDMYDLSSDLAIGTDIPIEIRVYEHPAGPGTEMLVSSFVLYVDNPPSSAAAITSFSISPGTVSGTLDPTPADATTELFYRTAGQSGWLSGGYVSDSFALSLSDADGQNDFELQTATYDYDGTSYSEVITVNDVPASGEGTGSSSDSHQEEEDEFWGDYSYAS